MLEKYEEQQQRNEGSAMQRELAEDPGPAPPRAPGTPDSESDGESSPSGGARAGAPPTPSPPRRARVAPWNTAIALNVCSCEYESTPLSALSLALSCALPLGFILGLLVTAQDYGTVDKETGHPNDMIDYGVGERRRRLFCCCCSARGRWCCCCRRWCC